MGGSKGPIGQTDQPHFTQQAGGKGSRETATALRYLQGVCVWSVHVCVAYMLLIACKCSLWFIYSLR